MAREMVVVIFNSSIESEMMEALRTGGVTCFTKVPGIQGYGEHSDPRLDSHVWPGTNTMLMICLEPEIKEGVLGAIRAMKEKHLEEGVRAFVLPVLETI